MSGGSDGMLTVRAGRVAKNAFLRFVRLEVLDDLDAYTLEMYSGCRCGMDAHTSFCHHQCSMPVHVSSADQDLGFCGVASFNSSERVIEHWQIWSSSFHHFNEHWH